MARADKCICRFGEGPQEDCAVHGRKAPLSSKEVAEYPKDLAGYLRKCSLCDNTGVIEWGAGICPRCGGPESVERRAADALDRLTARVAELEALAERRQVNYIDMRSERDRLRAALKAVQKLGGKTLLGGESHEPAFAHQLGANLAFCQAAEIASSALAGAADETEASPPCSKCGVPLHKHPTSICPGVVT